MNKRLKKKKHKYPFAQYGVDMDAEWVEDMPFIIENEAAGKKHQDNLFALVDKIEELGLECGGGGNNKTVGFFICSAKTNFPELAQINKLRAWMEDSKLFKNIVISNYKDAWYQRKLHQGDYNLLYTNENDTDAIRKWMDDEHVDTVKPGIIEDIQFT